MSDHDVIDSTAVEVYHAPPPALFGTTDPVEVVAKATAVADALADVIRAKRLFKHIGTRDHVLVEGWQLLGVMLGVTAVCVDTEPIENGYQATVEARTADGRVIGRADAICTKDERLWGDRDDYARLSMAQTRATSKALKGPLGFIVSLAGYATTPAEEMPAEHDQRPAVVRATDDERSAILTKSAERGLTPLEFLNALRTASGVERLDGLTDEQASAASQRILDRLPAELVAPVLALVDSADLPWTAGASDASDANASTGASMEDIDTSDMDPLATPEIDPDDEHLQRILDETFGDGVAAVES